jgi:hypothetical protein
MSGGTWELVDRPYGCKSMDCKWVFKKKLRPDLRDRSIYFTKLFITACLPLHQSCVEPRRIYREPHQSARDIQESTAA